MSNQTATEGAFKWVLAIALLFFIGIWGFHRHLSNSTLIPATSRGRQAPNFALSTPNGEIVHLTDYRGKAVLLNFFGNTCEPCLKEIPWLVEIQKHDKTKGLEIIGIEMYGASDDEIKRYAKQFGTNYTLVHGNETVSNAYGIGSFPTSYFVDARGTIVAAAVGLHSENEIETNVRAALNSELTSTRPQ
jgi:peroxiredoxin